MWCSREQAREVWPDAPLEDAVLDRLLTAAHEQVAAYAPLLGTAPVPQRYVEAELLQARELWSATKRDGDVLGGFDTYAPRARPLSATVKALLRPRVAKPRVR